MKSKHKGIASLALILIIAGYSFLSVSRSYKLVPTVKDASKSQRNFQCDWLENRLKDSDFIRPRHVAASLANTLTKSKQLNPHIEMDALDTEILIRGPRNKTLFLHQTWKSTCVYSHKVKEMKSWLESDDNLLTVFYEDDAMDAWVRKRFMGTKAFTVWNWLALDTAYTDPTLTAKEPLHFGGVKRADLFRLMLMWYYGGLYMDLDVRALRSWRELLEGNKAYMAWEPDPKYALAGIFAADGPGHPFFSFLLDFVVTEMYAKGRAEARDCGPVGCTGPEPVARAYREYAKHCGVGGEFPVVSLANELVQGTREDIEKCPGCLVNHIGTCTWCTDHRGESDSHPKNCVEVVEFMPPDRLIMVSV
ncbi:hypothetical protein HDU77_006124 [Chytriomyces hyalinus]|nr:hypothetical protein HDU77_006124 [Chytriomyces hyalinus]